MNSSVQLSSGRSRCELPVDLGLSPAGLWFDGVPASRSAPAPTLSDVTEHVSRVNNAPTLVQGDVQRLAGLGVTLLQSGESLRARMRTESGPSQ